MLYIHHVHTHTHTQFVYVMRRHMICISKTQITLTRRPIERKLGVFPILILIIMHIYVHMLRCTYYLYYQCDGLYSCDGASEEQNNLMYAAARECNILILLYIDPIIIIV